MKQCMEIMPINDMTKTVGVYIFDDVEVLDLAGQFEVFSINIGLYKWDS